MGDYKPKLPAINQINDDSSKKLTKKQEDLTTQGIQPILYNNYKRSITFKNCESLHSHYGSAETNLTGIHEDTGLIPGLNQWVKDLVLP